MNLPRCICVPHPESPSPLPPHPIPLGHPSAPALSTLSHSSNLDWQSISHMIIYMFQDHSPISSHPLPHPQSPKDCSIHLCLFGCLAYRVSITISRSSLRLTSIESVMPSSHLILGHPLLLLPLIPPSIRVFSNESSLRIRWPKYWSFSFSISPSNEYSRLISFKID